MKNTSIAIAALAVASVPVFGVDHIVGTAADGNSPDSLRALISSCANGDRILIPAGMIVEVDSVISFAKRVDFVGLGSPEECVIRGAGTNQLFNVENNGLTNMFANLTFRNGCNTSADSAGAIMSGSNHHLLAITNCVFENNRGFGGGAMRASSRKIVIMDTVFRQNHAESYGGALYPLGPVELYRCTFWSNSVPPGKSSGAVATPNFGTTTLYAKDCVFTNNIAGAAGALSIERQAVVEDCLFVDNYTEGGNAGAVHVGTGSDAPILRRCRFIANEGGSGSAMALHSRYPTIEDCVFERNISHTSSGTSWQGGGVIYQRNNFVGEIPVTNNLIRCVFRNNKSVDWPEMGWATGSQGVLSAHEYQGVYIIRDCLFENNSSDREIGAIHNKGPMEIENCVFIGNSSASNDGVIRNQGQLHVKNSSFVGNSAIGEVAAIRNMGSMRLENNSFIGNSAANDVMRFQVGNDMSKSAELINCTFYGNSTSGRGVFYSNNAGDPVALVNCTITSNFMASGSAIHANYGATGISNFAMTNCVVTENYRSNGAIDDINQGVKFIENCVFSEAESGFTKMTNATATYKGIAWNAAPARTRLEPPAVNGAKLLLPDGSAVLTCAFSLGSILRDTGAEIDASVIADARGFPRRDLWKGAIDIGAYEFQPEWATVLMVR